MKTTTQILLPAWLAIAVSLVACSDKQPSPAGDTLAEAKAVATEAMQDTQEATVATWNKLAAATYDERQAFAEGVDELAERIDQGTDQLADHGQTLSADARESWNSGLANLKEARTELAEELQELNQATAANWEAAKQEVAAAWRKVETAYDDLSASMSS